MARLFANQKADAVESSLDIMRGMAVGNWYLISHNTYHHKVRPACILSYERTEKYIDFSYRYFDDPQVRYYYTSWIGDDDHDNNTDIEIICTTKEAVADHIMACVKFALSQGI